MNNLMSKKEVAKTDNQQDSLENLFESLSKLIKEDKGNGIKAWEAGELLSQIKAKFNDNNEFFEELKKSGTSLNQAKTRMSIYEWIKDKKLITEKMYISQLEQVIRLKNEKYIEDILKILVKFEEEGKLYPAEIICSIVNEWMQNYDIKKEKNSNLQNIDNSNELNNPQEYIKTFFQENLELKMEEHKKQIKQNRQKKYLDVWGQNINSPCFPEIQDFYAKEPIDEQGFVGLFCTIFPILKNRNLFIKGSDFNFANIPKNSQLKFSKIKGIRQPFPDSIIEFEFDQSQKLKTTELFAEFEFESYNYIDHEHYKTPKKECHLIICWKHDDFNQKKWEQWKKRNSNFLKNSDFTIPLIFSVQKFFQAGPITGAINLINLN